MVDVFISYKKERRAHAKRLAGVLEAYGYDVWWDYGLLVDAGDYDTQIENKLNAAKAVVVLWCSGAVGSSFVKDEARRANNARKLLQAQIEADIEPPVGFGMAERVFLLNWSGDPAAEGVLRLVGGVERLAQTPRRVRPNLMELLKESAPLPAVTRMTIGAAADTNAPPAQGKAAPAHEGNGGQDALMADLRVTWATLARDDVEMLQRFWDRVHTAAPGSGLEFEVSQALEALRAKKAAEAEQRRKDEAAARFLREQRAKEEEARKAQEAAAAAKRAQDEAAAKRAAEQAAAAKRAADDAAKRAEEARREKARQEAAAAEERKKKEAKDAQFAMEQASLAATRANVRQWPARDVDALVKAIVAEAFACPDFLVTRNAL
ncbi:MAG: toll/interleukin-1 receptor domain-containing protein, partial [Hyphomonadaceae bacterium]